MVIVYQIKISCSCFIYHLYFTGITTCIYIYRTVTQAHGNGFCSSVGRALVHYQPLSLWSSKRIHFHNVESVHVYCKRVYIDTKFSKPGQVCSLQVNLIYSMCYTYDVSRLLNQQYACRADEPVHIVSRLLSAIRVLVVQWLERLTSFLVLR